MQAKDAARLGHHHAPDVVAYDLLEPLQYRGLTGVREHAQQWFDGYDGPIAYEIRDLVVAPGHDRPSAMACIASPAGAGRPGDRHVVARHTGLPSHRRQVAPRARAQLHPVRHEDPERSGSTSDPEAPTARREVRRRAGHRTGDRSSFATAAAGPAAPCKTVEPRDNDPAGQVELILTLQHNNNTTISKQRYGGSRSPDGCSASARCCQWAESR